VWRFVRGVIGNAVVWSGGWFVAAAGVFTTLAVTGIAHPDHWFDIVRGAAMFGVMGGISGTAFSLYIALRYRGQRLTNIHWLRFGLGGAVAIGIFVPSFIAFMRMVNGDPPLGAIPLLKNALVGVVFGGAAAAMSLRAAQLADRFLPAAGPRTSAVGAGGYQHVADERTTVAAER
jgi:hypothetical protein